MQRATVLSYVRLHMPSPSVKFVATEDNLKPQVSPRIHEQSQLRRIQGLASHRLKEKGLEGSRLGSGFALRSWQAPRPAPSTFIKEFRV